LTKTENRSLTEEQLRAELEKAVKRATAVLSRHNVARLKTIPAPKPISPEEILQLRQEFEFSQEVFARLLNVSLNTVQSWEQGTRVPGGAALKLLSIAKRYPQVMLDLAMDKQ
jgi:putative transcriptional regulator